MVAVPLRALLHSHDSPESLGIRLPEPRSARQSHPSPLVSHQPDCFNIGEVESRLPLRESARTRHPNSQGAGSDQHPLVVANKDGEITAETLRCREVDRVQTSKVFYRQQRGGVEQGIVDLHEFKTVDELPRAADRGRAVPPDRAHHLDSRERAGTPPRPPPHERAEGSGFRLADDELH
jgi:hypothetical protein